MDSTLTLYKNTFFTQMCPIYHCWVDAEVLWNILSWKDVTLKRFLEEVSFLFWCVMFCFVLFSILEKGVHDCGGRQETKVENMSRCWRVEWKKKMTESLGEGSEWIMKSEKKTKALWGPPYPCILNEYTVFIHIQGCLRCSLKFVLFVAGNFTMLTYLNLRISWFTVLIGIQSKFSMAALLTAIKLARSNVSS